MTTDISPPSIDSLCARVDDLFSQFSGTCEREFQDEIYRCHIAAVEIGNETRKITRPKAASHVLQADGSKKWIDMDQSEYQAKTEACNAIESEIRARQQVFISGFEKALLQYMNFLNRSHRFTNGDNLLFNTEYDIERFLYDRVLDYWLDRYSDDCSEWLGDWMRGINFSAFLVEASSIEFRASQPIFTSYDSATSRAHFIAQELGTEMVVLKLPQLWQVRPYDPSAEQVVQPRNIVGIPQRYQDQEFDKDPFDDVEDEPYVNDANEADTQTDDDIREERDDYARGVARSNSNGWFYED